MKEGSNLNIAIIADDSKKELMAQFCTAYSSIFSKHRIFATAPTGKLVADAAGLSVTRLLSGCQGGAEQISSRIQYGEIDVLLFFRDGLRAEPEGSKAATLLRLCDAHQVPYATNVATAEVIVMALDRGDLDWRVYANGENII